MDPAFINPVFNIENNKPITLLSKTPTEIEIDGKVFNHKVSEKLRQAQDAINYAAKKTNNIDQKLRDVEEMPLEKAEELLSLSASASDDDI